MHPIDAALLVAAVLGHWALSVFAINRIHATGWPHHWVKLIDLFWYGVLLLVPAAMVICRLDPRQFAAMGATAGIWLELYILFCAVMAPVAAAVGIKCRRDMRPTGQLISNHTTRVDAVARLGHPPCGSLTTRLASKLPGNQVFEIWEHDKTLLVPQLDPRLDGLTITHLSDLHFTGRITKPFFRLIVEMANQAPADLVVITGDIIDKRECFGWLREVLGELQSRVATCFVLGNHDLRIHDEAGLRAELTRLGMIDLGKRYELLDVRGCPIVLAGNELPWFPPPADLTDAPRDAFRIADVHTPDQLGWARANDCDLLLAGHTHGGQIQFPVIGPLFSPSRYGVRYSAGTFAEPPTLMHVSRGLSGTRPLRFGCAPELARLVLRRQ